MKKEKLKQLVVYILKRALTTSKVKLAKLILFSEIAYFNKTGRSLTGLYFVRLKYGPVVAFFDEVLEENVGKAWQKETQNIPIHEEGVVKEQYLYSAIVDSNLSKEEKDTINKVVKVYGRKSDTELSRLSHSLPAWKYSEPNEPIYIAELAAKEEAEYFALIDILENTEEDDSVLSEKIPRSLSAD